MIQRIQTLYLLVVVILSAITLFSPLAGLINAADGLQYVLNFKGVSLVAQTGNQLINNVWALTALMSIIPLVALFTVFMYKKRILQIRLSIFNTVLMAGYYGLLFIYIWQAGQKLHADWSLEIVSAFPLVNIILNLLAIRSIGKDEALVKSLNRLR